MKTIFIATGQFGAIILEKLARSQFKPDFLICPPDKPVGRKQILMPCPAKLIAQKYNLEISEFNNLTNKADFFRALKPDLIIVADTNFILPKELLSIPLYGCLNIHPSLLPKYRGPSPIQSVLLAGETETGITIIKMDEKIDHGRILIQKKITIDAKETYPILRERLANLAAELLIKIIPQWTKDQITPLKQNDQKATFTKKLKKEDGLIDWRQSAVQIQRQIRALNPWPGTFTFFEWKGNKKRLKILEAKVIKLAQKNTQPGDVFRTTNHQMAVACGKNALILEKVQPAGKNEMTGNSFINGYKTIKKFCSQLDD